MLDEGAHVGKREHETEANESAAAMAVQTAGALEHLALLASPRLVEKAGLPFSRTNLLDQLDALLHVFEDMRASSGSSAPPKAFIGEGDLRQLRRLCEAWSLSEPVPADIRQTARHILESYGIEPPDGWDTFAGPRKAVQEAPSVRPQRAILRLQCGPDPLATALSNAMYVLEELTSSRRIRTLAMLPTRYELLSAVDTYINWPTTNSAIHPAARALRGHIEHWTPSTDLPLELQHAARSFLNALGAMEPPSGWDAYDGHPETWRPRDA